MDPKTGMIYDEDEIPALEPDVQKRLIRGELEELQQLSTLIQNVKDENDAKEVLQEVEERFYPINRAARRRAEKRDRATRKRDPRG